MYDNRNLPAKEWLEIFQSQIGQRLLLALARFIVIPILGVTHPFAELIADYIIHTHASGADFTAAPFGITGLCDFQHAGESNQNIFEFAWPRFHERAPTAHVGARTRNKRDCGYAARHCNFELVIVWANYVEDAKFGIGLI